MAKIVSRYIGQYVYIFTKGKSLPQKVKCLGLLNEAGRVAYWIQHEDGLEEPIFVNTVTRIVNAKELEMMADIYDDKESSKLIN